MNDEIIFTPIPTALVPSPSELSFIPALYDLTLAQLVLGFYSVTFPPLKRRVGTVNIDFTDVSFTRNRGLSRKVITIKGTDTFNLYIDAKDQLDLLEKMIGTECVIHSTMQGGTVFNGDCLDVTTAGIIDNDSPGFHIHYTISFSEGA